MTQVDKRQARYVRISPTVLRRVPDCYGAKGKPDPLSDTCIHCFLKKWCQERQEVVWR